MKRNILIHPDPRLRKVVPAVKTVDADVRRLAEEANELKSRFLSTVSHELRAPLNLIVGLSEMLLQQNDEGDTRLPERLYRSMTSLP